MQKTRGRPDDFGASQSRLKDFKEGEKLALKNVRGGRGSGNDHGSIGEDPLV